MFGFLCTTRLTYTILLSVSLLATSASCSMKGLVIDETLSESDSSRFTTSPESKSDSPKLHWKSPGSGVLNDVSDDKSITDGCPGWQSLDSRFSNKNSVPLFSFETDLFLFFEHNGVEWVMSGSKLIGCFPVDGFWATLFLFLEQVGVETVMFRSIWMLELGTGSRVVWDTSIGCPSKLPNSGLWQIKLKIRYRSILDQCPHLSSQHLEDFCLGNRRN